MKSNDSGTTNQNVCHGHTVRSGLLTKCKSGDVDDEVVAERRHAAAADEKARGHERRQKAITDIV